MSSQPINKQIINQLTSRGFKNVKASNTRKLVLKFERNRYAQNIFKTISDRPFLRALIHLLAQEKLPITKDQVQQVLTDTRERLKTVLRESPEKNLLCRNCSEIIHRYNIYEEDKPSWKMKCPKCNTPNELSQCEEKNDWSFPVISVTSYLDKLVKTRILTSTVLGNCARCMRSESFKRVLFEDLDSLSILELKRYAKKLYCKQCGRFYDLMEIYNATDLVMPLWIKDGVWFEWYVKNIIKKHLPRCPIEQGLIVSNGEAMQVDVILLKNGKIISFECKALSLRKSASFNEVSDALKPLDFSDEVFLVTTTVLKENDKKILLKRGGRKLKVVEGPNIEDIMNFIRN